MCPVSADAADAAGVAGVVLRGGDVTACQGGHTALVKAAFGGHVRMMRVLVHAGAGLDNQVRYHVSYVSDCV